MVGNQASSCSAGITQFALCSFGSLLLCQSVSFTGFKQNYNGSGNEYNGCERELYS